MRTVLGRAISVRRPDLLLAAVILAIATAVLYPIFRPGYLVLLDTAFGPRMPSFGSLWSLSGTLQSQTPLALLFALLNHGPFKPLVGKLFLYAVFLVAGVSAASMAGRARWGRLYAVVLVMVNPWVLDRLSAGQTGLVAAYALLPLALALTIRLVDGPSMPRLWATALTCAAIGVMDPHQLYLLAAVFAVLAVWRWWRTPTRAFLRRTAAWSAALGGLLVLLQLYWLVPTLLSRSVVSQFGRADLHVFATRPDPQFGIVFNTAALYGFWRQIDATKDHLPAWWLLALVIFALALVGLATLWRDREHRWLAGALATVWLLAMFVGMGISFAPTRPLWLWLFDHFPGFAGWREPQKASAFIAVVYAYLGALGVERVIAWWRASRGNAWLHPQVVAAALILVPLLFGARELAGLSGLLRPSQYPQSWYEAARYLEEHNDGNDAVLFLPWHAYLPFPFTGGTVSNPATLFFPGRIISGDNIEVALIYTQSTNPRSLYIDALLSQRERLTDLGNLLAPLDVRYVILARTSDYASYGFLRAARDLRLVREWDDLELWENTRPVSRFYSVSTQVWVPDMAALIERSRSEDLRGAVYRIGEEASSATPAPIGDASPVAYEERGPLWYRVERPSGPWLVFADPYDAGWRYAGRRPIANAGAVNAFASASGPATLAGRGLALRWAATGLSAATAAAGLAYLARRRLRANG